MGGVALLARDLGHDVSGSDAKVYPPMSTQLEAQGIRLMEGYVAAHLDSARPDLVIIGNALSRGNALVEAVLERGIRYTSGAQWIGENILRCAGTHKCRGRQDTASDHGRWVLAGAGTHGKTSTGSKGGWVVGEGKVKTGVLMGGGVVGGVVVAVGARDRQYPAAVVARGILPPATLVRPCTS